MDVDKVVEKLVVDYGIERRITNIGKEKLKNAYRSLLGSMEQSEAFDLLSKFADAFTSEERVLNFNNQNGREGYNRPPANIKLPKTPPRAPPAPPAPPPDYENTYYEASKGNNPAPAGRKPAPPPAPPPAPLVNLIAESDTAIRKE